MYCSSTNTVTDDAAQHVRHDSTHVFLMYAVAGGRLLEITMHSVSLVLFVFCTKPLSVCAFLLKNAADVPPSSLP